MADTNDTSTKEADGTTDADTATKQDASTDINTQLLQAIKDLALGQQTLRREFIDDRRESRKATSPAKGKEASATPQAWTAEDTISFRDAIDDSGITLTVNQKRNLEKLAKASGELDNTVDWIKAQVTDFGWNAGANASADKVNGKAVVMNPPVGTNAGKNQLPDNPKDLTQAQVDAMSAEEVRNHRLRFEAKNKRGPANPFGSVGAAPRK
jgi:hypothetical protein